MERKKDIKKKLIESLELKRKIGETDKQNEIYTLEKVCMQSSFDLIEFMMSIGVINYDKRTELKKTYCDK